jgi:uncharacterized protein (TIGR02147 family)
LNIYNELDYRQILKKLVENRKKIDSSVNFQNMASSCRIQKAYLSQVIKGVRDLNQDQLYMACQYLNLDSDEKKFLVMLLEYSRCGLEERKKEILKKIKLFQKDKRKTSSHIDVNEMNERKVNREDYFLDPLNQIIHMCLSIPEFKVNPKLISKNLFLPREKVLSSLKKLESMGIIEFSENGILDKEVDLHLPQDSPIFDAWRSQLNTLSLNRIKKLKDSKTYNFSAIFGSNEKIRKEIHTHFLEFLNKTKELVTDSEVEEVFQVNFDLFSWTETQ